jgi:hypothetical protein
VWLGVWTWLVDRELAWVGFGLSSTGLGMAFLYLQVGVKGQRAWSVYFGDSLESMASVPEALFWRWFRVIISKGSSISDLATQHWTY